VNTVEVTIKMALFLTNSVYTVIKTTGWLTIRRTPRMVLIQSSLLSIVEQHVSCFKNNKSDRMKKWKFRTKNSRKLSRHYTSVEALAFAHCWKSEKYILPETYKFPLETQSSDVNERYCDRRIQKTWQLSTILKPRLHDTTCCQTGCQTRLTTGCIV